MLLWLGFFVTGPSTNSDVQEQNAERTDEEEEAHGVSGMYAHINCSCKGRMGNTPCTRAET